MIDELERSILGEGNHEVNALERGEDVGAFGFRPYRPGRSLEAADGSVSVDADDQGIALGASRGQQVDVARMKKIENTIGEDYPAFPLTPPLLRLRPCSDLSRRISRPQRRLLTDGWKRSTFSFLRGSGITSS